MPELVLIGLLALIVAGMVYSWRTLYRDDSERGAETIWLEWLNRKRGS